MTLLETATATLLALVAWALMSLVVALLLARVIRVADRLERRAGSLEEAVRAVPRLAMKPRDLTPEQATAVADAVDLDDPGVVVDVGAAQPQAVAARSAPASSPGTGHGRRRAAP